MNNSNLIYIMADQLRYQSCGYAGDEYAKTPNIDALAANSMNVCNAISNMPVCSAYRASLLTGKYTTSTGMVINEIRLNPNHKCFGHVLTENGYETAYMGKWHLWANELGNHSDPANSFTPPGSYRLGFDGLWAAYNFHHEYYNGYYHTDSPEKISYDGYEPDCQTDMAIDYLNRVDKDKPFALFLSCGTPHDPWVKDNVPTEYYDMFKDIDFKLTPSYSEKTDPHGDDWSNKEKSPEKINEWKRIYYAMTANLDYNIGRLLKAVRQNNLDEDTIIVFTSDHGEMFGAHGRMMKNIFYDEAARIPFLINWAGKINAGSTDVCLSTVDIMPTLLSLMDMQYPQKVEGMDLSRSILGHPDAPEPKAAFMQNTGACAAWENGHEWRALRDKQYTYAVFKSDNQELLFDNINDPYNLNNLADSEKHNEMLNNFRQMLKQKMDSINDNFEDCTWYRDNWIEDRCIMQTATMGWEVQPKV